MEAKKAQRRRTNTAGRNQNQHGACAARVLSRLVRYLRRRPKPENLFEETPPQKCLDTATRRATGQQPPPTSTPPVGLPTLIELFELELVNETGDKKCRFADALGWCARAWGTNIPETYKKMQSEGEPIANVKKDVEHLLFEEKTGMVDTLAALKVQWEVGAQAKGDVGCSVESQWKHLRNYANFVVLDCLRSGTKSVPLFMLPGSGGLRAPMAVASVSPRGVTVGFEIDETTAYAASDQSRTIQPKLLPDTDRWPRIPTVATNFCRFAWFQEFLPDALFREGVIWAIRVWDRCKYLSIILTCSRNTRIRHTGTPNPASQLGLGRILRK